MRHIYIRVKDCKGFIVLTAMSLFCGPWSHSEWLKGSEKILPGLKDIKMSQEDTHFCSYHKI